MTVTEFVYYVLRVPVTRIGSTYIIEAIEIVVDTRDKHFYPRLAEIHRTSTRYLEKALRDAKNLSLRYMNSCDVMRIFGKSSVTTNEYIIKAAEVYKNKYENEKA